MSARNSARAAGAAALALLAGCAVGPDFEQPKAPAVDHYTAGTDPAATVAAGAAVQRFVPGATVAGEWWHLFRSPVLDRAVAEALAGNPGLAAAQASLRQAQANLQAGYGVFFPEIDGGFAAERQKFSPARFGQSGAGSLFNLFTLSATVSYTLDLWGGERRMVEGLEAARDQQQANEQATFLALTANVVNTLVAGAAYRAEIDATREIVALESEQVRLAEVQAKAGTVAYSTVLSLESQRAAAEAQIPALEQKLAQATDLLASLSGHTPAEGRPPPVALADLTLPGELPVSLPADLVRQRPDILMAEASLHQAAAGIGVATAALLPSVTLSGTYGVNNTSADALFGANSRYWSYGSNVTQTLFDAGTLWQKRKAAIEGFNQAKADYRQTVLAAFQQVADTLRALEHDAQALAAEEEALAAADQALHLVEANYRAGIATYLDLLNADTQDHQARIARLEALAQRYQDTVGLLAALGGGWWNRPEVEAHAS